MKPHFPSNLSGRPVALWRGTLVLWAVLQLFPAMRAAADVDAEIDAAPIRVDLRGVPQLVGGFQERPWVRQILESALFDRWQSSPPYRDAAASLERLEGLIGGPIGKHLAELIDDGAVLLMDPRPEKGPRVVVVGIAADDKIAPRLLAVWNQAERVTLTSHVRGGNTVWERRPVGGGRSVSYATTGTVWLLGSHVDLLHGLLTLGEDGLRQRFGGDSGTGDDAESGMPRLSVKLDPAACAEALDLRSFRNSDDVGERWIATQWDALSLLRMELSEVRGEMGSVAGPGLRLALEGRWRPGQVTSRWTDWVAAVSGGRAEVFDRVPEGTLVALGGRIQPRLGLGLFPAPQDEATVRELSKLRRIARGVLLGLDLYEEVLARLPVNWGLFVLSRPPTAADPLPVGAVFAWQMPTPPADEPAGGLVARGLMNALQTGLTLWATAENEARPRRAGGDKDPSGKVEKGRESDEAGEEPVISTALTRGVGRGGEEVFRLDGLPFGRPSFALAGGYLVTASHPELIEAFADPSQAMLTLSSRLERRLMQPDLLRERQLVAHVAVSSIRTWLREYKPALAQLIGQWRNVPADEVTKRLDRMGEVLEPLDDLAATVSWQREAVLFELFWLGAE